MTQSLQHLVLANQATTDIIVQLFILDATKIGAGVMYFTPGGIGSSKVMWQGTAYEPLPVQITGLESSSQGSQPRPKISLSNIDLAPMGNPYIPLFVKQSEDLVGSTITRIRTWQRFLDNGSTPDPNAFWPPQTFIVDRKSAANKTTLEWELANPLDQRNLKIPGRLALKNTCTHDYRHWAGSYYDYSKATCPYSGAAYFDNKGKSQSDPSKDKCGKRLSDCRLRFGQHAVLPFQGFPAMRRT